MKINKYNNEWEIVIGLEIHAQLNTQSKMFSYSRNDSRSIPNSNVSEIDMAMPGTLPSFNKECLKLAVRAGLGLNCKINKYSEFDRKNYFYADLPHGYQRTQFFHPIASEGYIQVGDQKIRICRIHMENDAGKSMHDKNHTLVDLNRAGVGLIEIVTEPDIRCPEVAANTVKEIRNIVRSLEVCLGDLEKGTLRCDANVSVRLVGATQLGTRCEIKNINSYKNIEKAIKYEANRQIDEINQGKKIQQTTMLFDDELEITLPMRTKEDAEDYRYFKDPDLPPIIIDEDYIKEVRRGMPEVLSDKVARYMTEYKITEYEANILTSNKRISDYFEYIASQFKNYNLLSSWMIGELFSILNKYEIEFEQNPISAENFLELLKMIDSDVISGKIAKGVLKDMYEENKTAVQIVQEKGLKQISNLDELKSIISNILQNNEPLVIQYREGKTKVLASIVGLIMKETKGQANPKLVNDILVNILNEKQ